MRSLLILTSLIAILAAGCIPTSLYPIYTKSDVIFKPELVGEWGEEGSGEIFEFVKTDEDSYELLIRQQGEGLYIFEAHLVNVYGKLFLDIYPKEVEGRFDDYFMEHLIPVHSFLRVKQIGPELQAAYMNVDWIADFVKKHPSALDYDELGNRFLITSKTQKIREFLKEVADSSAAYEDFSHLKRLEP